MSQLMIIFIFLTCIVWCSAYKNYNGYQLIRIKPQSQYDIDELNKLDEEVDFWSHPSVPGKPVSLVVAPSGVKSLTRKLTDKGIHYDVISNNLEKIIEKERSRAMEKMQTGLDLFTYNRIHDIHLWMESLAETCSFCEVFDIGYSTEGRPLKVFKISLPGGQNRKAIWIDAGIHAREWIAPATAVYIINQLVNTYATNTTTRLIVEALDWYILPSMNPDGYEYTFTTDRLWRKTRSENPDSYCIGTDPNRNWDFHWMETGASANPCSSTYGGSVPFSEPETAAVADFIYENRDQFLVYLTFHSYGQYWLTPWGYTSDYPEDYNDLYKIAKLATDALRSVHGTEYTIGTSTNVLYAAAGGSDDWAKGVAGIKFSYTVELRDVENYGFILPPDQIQPTGEETWLAIQSLAFRLAVLRTP